MNKIVLIIGFLIVSLFTYGQNHNLLDSLQKRLNTEKSDSVKSDLYNAFSIEYFRNSEYLKAESYASKALFFAQKVKYQKGMLRAYFNLIYANHLDWVKGKPYFDKALELANNMNDKRTIAKVYSEIANYLSSLNQFHPEIYAKKALTLYTELNDSLNIAETCYRLSETYAFWNKSISKGEPEIALEYLNKSMYLYKKLGNVVGVMQCYMGFSNIYKVYYNNKNKTKEFIELSLKEIKYYLKQNPENLDYQIREHIVYFHWAMYYYEMENDMNIAESYLKKSISLAEKIFPLEKGRGLNHGMLRSYYQHLGQIYLDNNRLYDAEICFNKLLQTENKYDTVSRCYRMQNIEWIYRNKGMLAKAYGYLDTISALSNQTGNIWLKWQSQYYLADLYQLMEDNETAKNIYYKCYRIAKNGNHFAGQIVSLTDISKMYSKMNMLDSALYFNQLAEQLNSFSIKDTLLYAWIYNDLGGIYEKKKDFAKALSIYLKVLEIREKNNWNQTVEIPYGYIATNSCLARVYLELKQYDKAFEFVNKSLSSFQYIKYPEILRDDYLTLSKIYEYRNQPILALEYYKKYMAERDKIQADQNQRKIQLLEIEKIENQKKQEIESLNIRNELKETKLRQQKYVLYSVLAVLILTLILVFVIFKNYRQKSKVNYLLKLNEQELLSKNKRLQQLNEEVNAQNEEIKKHRDLLAEQKDKITDSIVFASLIQHALLPDTRIIENHFSDYFLYYNPKDIVSGDFYWFKQIENFVYIVIADGTGHGVPGAFMSTLGISLLNEVFGKNEIKSPEIVLEELRERVLNSMQQNATSNGMDMALCLINMETNVLSYAGANIPLYHVKDKELLIYKADRMPIGDYPKAKQKFNLNQIQLNKGDMLYIFTDGYISQLGGNNYLKYSAKRLQNVLFEIQESDLNNQKQIIEKSYKEWLGNHEQVDDILGLGIRI
jgi:serine phosphatase RsbU (regulator of sigma subunit)